MSLFDWREIPKDGKKRVWKVQKKTSKIISDIEKDLLDNSLRGVE
ncbi:MAG: hypothetical protein U9O78_03015 [Patescibacteria group bacterium]|nr:hypothetical protein [Patescibacteria group bacterium]